MECWVVGHDFAAHAPGDRTFEDIDALRSALVQEDIEGRTILLKGSRSMRMEALVEDL